MNFWSNIFFTWILVNTSYSYASNADFESKKNYYNVETLRNSDRHQIISEFEDWELQPFIDTLNQIYHIASRIGFPKDYTIELRFNGNMSNMKCSAHQQRIKIIREVSDLNLETLEEIILSVDETTRINAHEIFHGVLHETIRKYSKFISLDFANHADLMDNAYGFQMRLNRERIAEIEKLKTTDPESFERRVDEIFKFQSLNEDYMNEIKEHFHQGYNLISGAHHEFFADLGSVLLHRDLNSISTVIHKMMGHNFRNLRSFDPITVSENLQYAKPKLLLIGPHLIMAKTRGFLGEHYFSNLSSMSDRAIKHLIEKSAIATMLSYASWYDPDTNTLNVEGMTEAIEKKANQHPDLYNTTFNIDPLNLRLQEKLACVYEHNSPKILDWINTCK